MLHELTNAMSFYKYQFRKIDINTFKKQIIKFLSYGHRWFQTKNNLNLFKEVVISLEKKIYDPPYLYMLVYTRQFSVGSLATYSRPEAEGQRLHNGATLDIFRSSAL